MGASFIFSRNCDGCPGRNHCPQYPATNGIGNFFGSTCRQDSPAFRIFRHCFFGSFPEQAAYVDCDCHRLPRFIHYLRVGYYLFYDKPDANQTQSAGKTDHFFSNVDAGHRSRRVALCKSCFILYGRSHHFVFDGLFGSRNQNSEPVFLKLSPFDLY